MSAAPDPYAGWDAAYVLGALSAEERREFERHLDGCAACSRSVAELAGLPGLLAAVPREQALRLDGDDPVLAGVGIGSIPPATLPRLLSAARRQRRRVRALIAGGIVLAAAAVTAVALLLPGWFGTVGPGVGPGAEAMTLSQVVPSPLSAEVRFSAESWGTRVDVSCSYARRGKSGAAQPYALYVTDRSGASEVVATWLAGPGTTVTPVGTTRFDEDDIASVDVRWLPSGKVLLEGRLTP